MAHPDIVQHRSAIAESLDIAQDPLRGQRALIVTTPAGESSATLSAGNLVRVAAQLGNTVSAIASPVGVIVAWVPAIVGGTIGMILIGVATTVVFLVLRRPWDALNVGGAIALVVAIGAPMAAVIARARPTDSLAETVATSFPSGHTAVATTIVVTLGLILRRRWVWAAGAIWVVLMMWSRTYLHAHWLSDVTAGLLEGIAVATLVWAAVETGRERRAQRAAAPAP